MNTSKTINVVRASSLIKKRWAIAPRLLSKVILGLLLINQFSQLQAAAGSSIMDAPLNETITGRVLSIFGATSIDPDEPIFASVDLTVVPENQNHLPARERKILNFYHEDRLCAFIHVPGVRPCGHVTLRSVPVQVGDRIEITQKQAFWSQRKTIVFRKLPSRD